LVGELPPELNREEAVGAMERTKAFDYNEGGHLQALASSCPSIASLQEEFRDIDLDDEDTDSVLDGEANLDLEVANLLDENPPRVARSPARPTVSICSFPPLEKNSEGGAVWPDFRLESKMATTISGRLNIHYSTDAQVILLLYPISEFLPVVRRKYQF
jgi:hypothetical protein